MIKRLKPKSEFSRNVLTLMTGTTIAQAIPIAVSPILTRIYTPENFGVFALIISMSTIISVAATAVIAESLVCTPVCIANRGCIGDVAKAITRSRRSCLVRNSIVSNEFRRLLKVLSRIEQPV